MVSKVIVGDCFGIKDYAKGNDTDDSYNIQKAFDDGKGKVIIFPYGGKYRLSKALSIHKDTLVVASGATLYNTKVHQTFLAIDSGVKIIGLEIEGAGHLKPNSKGIGITAKGKNSSSYLSDILLSGLKIHNMGHQAVYLQFVEDSLIEKSTIKNIGYAGITGSSCTRVNAINVDVVSVTGLTNKNAYGIVFTRKNGDSIREYPPSLDCMAMFCLIEDIPTWEALDTHGGIGIKFLYNTINNCKNGVILTDAGNAKNEDVFASHDCIVIGNKGRLTGKGYAVAVSGNSTELARNNVIDNNEFENAGIEGNSTAGAIRLANTIGTIVNANILKECFTFGLCLLNDNYDLVATKNEFIDIQESVYSGMAGIGVRAANNTGYIAGNKFIVTNPKLNKFVGEAAIRVDVERGVRLILGKNESGFKEYLSGIGKKALINVGA